MNFEIIKSTKELINLLEKPRFNSNQFLITSYEMIRNDKFIDFLSMHKDLISFDLSIFDEAHWMKNEQSKQHKIGQEITSISHRVLFLTATPIQMVENDLFNLLNLLDENEYTDKRTFDLILNINKPLVKAQRLLNGLDFSKDELLTHIKSFENISDNFSFNYDMKLINEIKLLVKMEELNYNNILKIQENITKLNLLSSIYNRTRKIDVTENKVIREARKEACFFYEYEKDYYERITEIVREAVTTFNETEKKVPVGWIANNYQRQITSSILSFIAKRKDNKFIADEDFDIEFDSIEDVTLSETIMSMINCDKDLIRLENKIYNSKNDSKLEKLNNILDDILIINKKPKIMLFSFFKASLKIIQSTISNHEFEIFRIDGSIDKKNRPEIVQNFKNCDSPSILLSSKIGTEGLDFQFCDILINYDLPWNPMELEQRIGRLDRIGQKAEKIHIYNLYYEDSIEDRILMKLYDRIGIFKNSIGDLEDIIDSNKSLLQDIYNPLLSPEEKEERLQRNQKAIINQSILIEEIESKADEFLGLDQYFTNKIKKIKDNKQYLTTKHINSIYEDFFSSKFPKAKYEYNTTTNTGTFIVGSEFRRDIRDFLLNVSEENTDDESVINSILRKTSIDFTFDGIVASENTNLEFLNVFHPITKSLIDYYHIRRDNDELVNTYNIMLITEDLPEDYYLLFTTIIMGKAFVTKNYYTTIIINSKGEEYSTDDFGMDFLSKLLDQAVDSPYYHPFKESDFEFYKHKYDHIIAQNYSKFEEEFTSEARRTYEKKILSVNQAAQMKINSLQDTIMLHEENIRINPEKREKLIPIIKMNKGYIESLTFSKEKQINKIKQIYDSLICDYGDVTSIGILKVQSKSSFI